MKTLLSTFMFGLMSFSAAADWDRTPVPAPYPVYGNEWTTCRTKAGFQTYEDGDYGLFAARNRVIDACSKWHPSSPGECRFNVQCSTPMTDWYACTTSAGYQQYQKYTDAATSLPQALEQVVASCDKWNAASECRYNAQCKAPMSDIYFKPMTTCQTKGGSTTYRDADFIPEVARQRTISQCAKWNHNGGECRARVVCEVNAYNPVPVPPVRRDPRISPVGVIDATPGVPHARVQCETYSGRIRVVGRGNSAGVVNARVTEVCRNTYGTYPRECDEHIVCSVR